MQVDRVREEGGDVENALEKEGDVEKPKKKKRKAKEKEEVEAPDVGGRGKKKAKKRKKLKTGREVEEGGVGDEGDSLLLVSSKKGHIKEKGKRDVNGKLGVVAEGTVECDVDKVRESKKKAHVKVKKKKPKKDEEVE